jgi:hypothetical protein
MDDTTINIIEKMAYGVWYAKFESDMKIVLADHRKNVESEFSAVRKYKIEIYAMFEELKAMQMGIKMQLQEMQYIQKRTVEYHGEIKEIIKKIEHTDRKLSYALGDPYDKRNLKNEYKKEEREND